MSRIIFLDVDGTLVDYDNHLPTSAVEAIRAARAIGHRVYLTTGRSRAEVYPELWEIGLDGLIGANGGYVESDGEVVFHQSLTEEQTAEVVDWLHERGCEFYLESNSGLYASRGFETAGDPVISRYQQYKGRDGGLTVRDAFPDMIFGAELYRDDINKISYLLNTPEDFEAAKERFPELKSGTWGGRGSHALFGDLGVPDIAKNVAVQALLGHLGADLADTIAFGDATVDVPMLEYCAIGVAMGNSSDNVIAVADLVTDDVAEDGLARAFDRLGLTTSA